MTKIDGMTAVTLARLRTLGPHVTTDDYAETVLDFNASLCEDILEVSNLPKGTELRARLAMQDTRLAFRVLASIVSAGAQTEEQRENALFLLAKTIDDSLNVGAFYIANRSREAFPALETGESFAQKGAKASAEVRSAAADELWKKDALTTAQLICADTDITQDDLAERILDEWPAGRWKPEKGTLIIQIGIWERENNLARRKPRRRPSHNRVRKNRSTG